MSVTMNKSGKVWCNKKFEREIRQRVERGRFFSKASINFTNSGTKTVIKIMMTLRSTLAMMKG